MCIYIRSILGVLTDGLGGKTLAAGCRLADGGTWLGVLESGIDSVFFLFFLCNYCFYGLAEITLNTCALTSLDRNRTLVI